MRFHDFSWLLNEKSEPQFVGLRVSTPSADCQGNVMRPPCSVVPCGDGARHIGPPCSFGWGWREVAGQSDAAGNSRRDLRTIRKTSSARCHSTPTDHGQRRQKQLYREAKTQGRAHRGRLSQARRKQRRSRGTRVAHRQQTGRRREGRRQSETLVKQSRLQPSQRFKYAQKQQYPEAKFGTQSVSPQALVI